MGSHAEVSFLKNVHTDFPNRIGQCCHPRRHPTRPQSRNPARRIRTCTPHAYTHNARTHTHAHTLTLKPTPLGPAFNWQSSSHYLLLRSSPLLASRALWSAMGTMFRSERMRLVQASTSACIVMHSSIHCAICYCLMRGSALRPAAE